MNSKTRPDAQILTFMIADDNAAYRSGIRAELEQRNFALVGEATNVTSAVMLAASERPDICLVDLKLAGNGLVAVARIVKHDPAATVVVLAETATSADVLATLERGASGYLLKEIGGDELANTLRAAWGGEIALSRSLVPLLVYQVRRGSKRRLVLPNGTVSLTAREWDVGESLRDGLNTEEIATRLGVSPVTIRRHIGLLMRKLGAPNREAAIETLRMFAR